MTQKLLQAPSLAWHKLFRLKQRHILTKAGHMRLRYSLSLGLTLCLGLSSAAHSYYSADSASPFASAQASYIAPAEEIFAHSSIDDTPEASRQEQGQSLKDRLGAGLPSIAGILKSSGPVTMDLEVERGQTIAGLLQKAGISGSDSYDAVQAIGKYTDMRKIQPGQILTVRFESHKTNDEEMSIANLVMPLDPVKYISLERESDGFKSELHTKDIQTVTRAGYTTIQSSLYGSAARAGIPAPVIAEMIRIYSWDVDFQRDIRQGDKIEVLYEAQETEDGYTVSTGNILYAKLSTGGSDVPLYRYEMENGKIDYFNEKGQSIKKTLMKTPVDGARISSGFGMRKHPVLGYNKMHKGMDFAAPTGTPIYAAGDGVIESIGRNGGYGNYVRIRHNNKLKTAYGHMHKFAKNLKKGSRVEQGQIIGYVGSTGRSTGPHLHYEVVVNNKQVNPRSVDLPVGEQLEGRELANFKKLMNSYNKQYVSIASTLKYAQADSDDEKKKNS